MSAAPSKRFNLDRLKERLFARENVVMAFVFGSAASGEMMPRIWDEVHREEERPALSEK